MVRSCTVVAGNAVKNQAIGAAPVPGAVRQTCWEPGPVPGAASCTHPKYRLLSYM